jgi:hypothetical protein
MSRGGGVVYDLDHLRARSSRLSRFARVIRMHQGRPPHAKEDLNDLHHVLGRL